MRFSRNRRHNISMFIAILVSLTLLFSSLFVLTRFSHDCPGEGCNVCIEIRTCISTLHLLSQALGSGVIIIFAYAFVKKLVKRYEPGAFYARASLVELRVRLNR